MKVFINIFLLLIGSLAFSQEVFNLQTFKCFTDDSEPGLYYQITFGSEADGKLASTDFRSYGEEVTTGEKYNEKVFPSNIRPQVLSDGTLFFPAFDSYDHTTVELKIKKLITPIKWPLMTGTIIHGDFNSPVTCAYIGVKP